MTVVSKKQTLCAKPPRFRTICYSSLSDQYTTIATPGVTNSSASSLSAVSMFLCFLLYFQLLFSHTKTLIICHPHFPPHPGTLILWLVLPCIHPQLPCPFLLPLCFLAKPHTGAAYFISCSQ